jgi:hypothetical protein
MDIIKRKEALVLGLKRYYTGKPCKHGHIVERYIDGGCVECKKVNSEKWANNNSDKRKEINNKYNKNNRDKRRTSYLNWVMNNPEKAKTNSINYRKRNRHKLSARTKAWAMNNPDKYKLLKIAYQNRRYQATPLWYETDLVKHLYLKRDQLSKLWGITLHVDHIIPLQGKNVCGLHCWNNLQLLEASLNQSKSNNF